MSKPATHEATAIHSATGAAAKWPVTAIHPPIGAMPMLIPSTRWQVHEIRFMYG